MKVIDISSIANRIVTAQTSPTPIVGQFFKYFSKFDATKVLVVTDENIETDLRVMNQIFALHQLSQNITVLQVKPNESYNDKEQTTIKSKLYATSLRFGYLLPRFLLLVNKYFKQLPLRRKAKQGIYNDHSYLVSQNIDTKGYTLVICNNLISANAVNVHKGVEYIYDIHEFELFRNRKTQSVERSFYIYLREKQIFNRGMNLITISQRNVKVLSNIYHIPEEKITCIYNQNFIDTCITPNKTADKTDLLIYIGNVNMDRGLKDITLLTNEYDVLIIACTYNEEALAYLSANSNKRNLILFKGINYQEFLFDIVKKYKRSYSLMLINPINPSYRNALPNKFFQAQALGLPIVVYEDTYLAKIVKGYQCGIIYTNPNNKIKNIPDKEYSKMRKAMINNLKAAINQKVL